MKKNDTIFIFKQDNDLDMYLHQSGEKNPIGGISLIWSKGYKGHKNVFCAFDEYSAEGIKKDLETQFGGKVIVISLDKGWKNPTIYQTNPKS